MSASKLEQGVTRSTKVEHPTIDERRALGKGCGRRHHRPATPAGSRPRIAPIPVALLEEQNATREPTSCRCATAA